jgi:hypothetical protein
MELPEFGDQQLLNHFRPREDQHRRLAPHTAVQTPELAGPVVHGQHIALAAEEERGQVAADQRGLRAGHTPRLPIGTFVSLVKADENANF